MNNRSRVAAVVPAYNEAGRITSVLDIISSAPSVDEILIVTDGCTDRTNDEVRAWLDARADQSRPNCRLYALTTNIGKGGAMTYGAHRTDAEVLLFLDADLIGLKVQQVEDIVKPCLMEDPADMCTGLFGAVRGGLFGWWLGVCHRFWPSMTGQRAIRRDLFLSIPGLTHSRYSVETAITRFAMADPSIRVDHIYLHDVTHPIKEEKQGAWKGSLNRMRMYYEIYSFIGIDICRRHVDNLATRYRQEAVRLRERLNSK